ncbi:MAG TPA: hypothetical protein VFZ38_14070, partial [Vicinamibacterales bacterium]
MADPNPSALVNQLVAERTEAHRRYNEALTAVDRAIQALADWPEPPPAYDEEKLPAINDAFTSLAQGPPQRPGGIGGAMFDSAWTAIKPVLDRQMAFNAALVDHLNRNAVAHRQAHAALAQAIPALRDSFAALTTFESRLVQFLQQITPLADANYREIGDALEQLRSITNIAQRTAIAAQRAVGAQGAHGAMGAQGAPVSAEASAYVAFEDRFRGSESEIRGRQQDYLQYFHG